MDDLPKEDPLSALGDGYVTYQQAKVLVDIGITSCLKEMLDHIRDNHYDEREGKRFRGDIEKQTWAFNLCQGIVGAIDKIGSTPADQVKIEDGYVPARGVYGINWIQKDQGGRFTYENIFREFKEAFPEEVDWYNARALFDKILEVVNALPQTRKDKIEKVAKAIAPHVRDYGRVSVVEGQGAQLNITLEPRADRGEVSIQIIGLMRELGVTLVGVGPGQDSRTLSVRTNFEGGEVLKELAGVEQAKYGSLFRE